MSEKIFNRRFGLSLFGILIIIGFICFISLPLGAQEKSQKQEQEKIVETVIVENIEVPVRVFDGKQPVGGLTKQDFELYVNGKKRVINGFYETRKKLEQSGEEKHSAVSLKESDARPRLFVLIFNLSDYHQDLTSALDLFFKRIIRQDDHLMAITNRYFFPQWKIEDPEKTKREIVNILDKEVRELRVDMSRYENELKAMAINFRARLYDPYERKRPNFPAPIFREFFITYQFILEDIKTRYLSLPVDQYIKIADYLKSQQLEKWVLNFYQIGRLPLIDNFGQLQESIDYFSGGLDQGIGEERERANEKPSMGDQPPNLVEAKRTIKSLYLDFISELYKIDDMLVDDISKAFLNSGATFHTLIMKPVSPGFTEDFKYQAIGTDSESVLKKLSRLTGGSIVNSNKMKDFLQDITVKEDIIYMLTYVPSPGNKEDKLNVALNNKNYRVVYDDQRRLNSFKKVKNRLARENPDKDIEIKALSYNGEGEMLTVKLDNIKMVHFDGELFGAVQARIKIMGQNSKLVANFEKTYRGIKEEGIFQAKLPPLSRGSYNVVLEVKDLFSLNNFYVGDAVTITKK